MATAIVASLSVAFLAGCGGSNNHVVRPGAITSFSSRSYLTTSGTLASGETGTLSIAVAPDASTVNGTLTVVVGSTTYEVPVTGTVNSSGAFNVSGSATQNTQAFTVTASGTLPTLPQTSGGSVTITVNGSTSTASFGSETNISGTLDSTYFPIALNGNYLYQDTTVVNGGTPTVQTLDGFSTLSSYGNPLGTPAAATFNGTAVTETPGLTPDSSSVDANYYDTVTGTGLTEYGKDYLNGSGGVEERLTFAPALTIPFNLALGQTNSQTVALNFTVPGSSTIVNTETLNASFTFDGYENYIGPTGNYPNAAKFTYVTAYTTATGTDTTTHTVYSTPSVGVLQEHDVEVVTGTNAGTTTNDYLLTSVTAGKSAKARGGTANSSSFFPSIKQ